MAFLEKPSPGRVLLDDTVALTAVIEASQNLQSHTVSGRPGINPTGYQDRVSTSRLIKTGGINPTVYQDRVSTPRLTKTGYQPHGLLRQGVSTSRFTISHNTETLRGISHQESCEMLKPIGGGETLGSCSNVTRKYECPGEKFRDLTVAVKNTNLHEVNGQTDRRKMPFRSCV